MENTGTSGSTNEKLLKRGTVVQWGKIICRIDTAYIASDNTLMYHVDDIYGNHLGLVGGNTLTVVPNNLGWWINFKYFLKTFWL